MIFSAQWRITWAVLFLVRSCSCSNIGFNNCCWSVYRGRPPTLMIFLVSKDELNQKFFRNLYYDHEWQNFSTRIEIEYLIFSTKRFPKFLSLHCLPKFITNTCLSFDKEEMFSKGKHLAKTINPWVGTLVDFTITVFLQHVMVKLHHVIRSQQNCQMYRCYFHGKYFCDTVANENFKEALNRL